jgi:hypothetical protein
VSITRHYNVLFNDSMLAEYIATRIWVIPTVWCYDVQRRLKSIRENKMADVNEFELLLFAPLKYTR